MPLCAPGSTGSGTTPKRSGSDCGGCSPVPPRPGTWSLPEEEARRLLAEGYEAAEVGGLLEPPKILVVVPEERLRTVPGWEPVELRLGPELLAARFLALVPFRWRGRPSTAEGEAADR